MDRREFLLSYTKEELIELIEMYSKNWLAMDGVWFQSVESRLGMDEAMYHDAQAWSRFTVTEARRIKSFLKLEDRPGLQGLKKALELRFYANINRDSIEFDGDTLTYSCIDCRVQNARKQKGMPLHPCKPVGVIEYSLFAQTIDDRIKCECVSCYPEVSDDSCCCKWRFRIS